MTVFQGFPSVSPSLSATACILVLIWGQSNPMGTNSYLKDAPSRDWDEKISGCFIWDQYKRNTYLTHTFQDTNTSYLDEYSQFRPLTAGYGRSSVFYPWDPAVTPGVDGYGIGMECQLAYRLRQYYRRPVYIIKVGQGGTPVADAGSGNGDWHVANIDTKPESLMELMRDYFYGAGLYSLINDEGYSRSDIHLAGVVSMIGAKDSDGDTNYLTYETNLSDCIDEVRSWINPTTGTDVPWVVVRSEDYFDETGAVTGGHTRITEIREAQESIVAAGTNIQLVSCDDCERETSDAGEHIIGQGHIVLGNLVFTKIIENTIMTAPEGDVDPTT